MKPDTHSKNALRAELQLLKCARRLEQLSAGRLRADYGSSLARFDVLANLDLAPDHCISTTQLSRLLIASKGNITRLLDRMEADGLIYRRPNGRDRRISDVYLASKGAEQFRQMAVAHEQWMDDIFSALDDAETRELVTLLGKVRERIDRGLAD